MGRYRDHEGGWGRYRRHMLKQKRDEEDIPVYHPNLVKGTQNKDCGGAGSNLGQAIGFLPILDGLTIGFRW